MSRIDEFPRVHFLSDFDEQTQAEAEARGYLSHVLVETDDGNMYSVVFYDCTRLAQDLEYEVSEGRMCIAEPGLIVLPVITISNIHTSVRRLAEERYFSKMIPSQSKPIGA
jgi:hypothetical protein